MNENSVVRIKNTRQIMLIGEVNQLTASSLIFELLSLAGEGDEDITLFINSPGGSVTAGMAIYDTMQYVKCDVSTICIGLAASMGAFLLAGGSKNKRYALENAEIMIHQPSGGVSGVASDIDIAAKTGASTATISRVSKCLSGAKGGYRMVLSRAENEDDDLGQDNFIRTDLLTAEENEAIRSVIACFRAKK